jgi:hypothetical protein
MCVGGRDVCNELGLERAVIDDGSYTAFFASSKQNEI